MSSLCGGALVGRGPDRRVGDTLLARRSDEGNTDSHCVIMSTGALKDCHEAERCGRVADDHVGPALGRLVAETLNPKP